MCWHGGKRWKLKESNWQVWQIHRRMGMSGGLFLSALQRETCRRLTHQEIACIHQRHDKVYLSMASQVRALPGARELLAYLSRVGVPWAIAASGRLRTARSALDLLGISPRIPLITRDEVERAKPDPDLFLMAGQTARGGSDRIYCRWRQHLGPSGCAPC